MQEYYKILGLTEDATDAEVEAKYKELKEKYSRERFYEGEIGNVAASKLGKVEEAYEEIKESVTHGDIIDYCEIPVSGGEEGA